MPNLSENSAPSELYVRGTRAHAYSGRDDNILIMMRACVAIAAVLSEDEWT